MRSKTAMEVEETFSLRSLTFIIKFLHSLTHIFFSFERRKVGKRRRFIAIIHVSKSLKRMNRQRGSLSLPLKVCFFFTLIFTFTFSFALTFFNDFFNSFTVDFAKKKKKKVNLTHLDTDFIYREFLLFCSPLKVSCTLKFTFPFYFFVCTLLVCNLFFFVFLLVFV